MSSCLEHCQQRARLGRCVLAARHTLCPLRFTMPSCLLQPARAMSRLPPALAPAAAAAVLSSDTPKVLPTFFVHNVAIMSCPVSPCLYVNHQPQRWEDVFHVCLCHSKLFTAVQHTCLVLELLFYTVCKIREGEKVP